MRKMIVCMALVSLVGLMTIPGVGVFQLNAATAEGECFEVTSCGWDNCRSLGENYSCFNPDTCCCPFKSCV